MVSQEQLQALKVKHANLEKAIDDEIHRPLPDTVQIHTLKREKLRIKDEIARLSRS
ncbi:MAG: YdcH family protein [Alphaproteobacteria bacterium]|nr:YdcH family protein [Alphaproteobacteria bacterium]